MLTLSKMHRHACRVWCVHSHGRARACNLHDARHWQVQGASPQPHWALSIEHEAEMLGGACPGSSLWEEFACIAEVHFENH